MTRDPLGQMVYQVNQVQADQLGGQVYLELQEFKGHLVLVELLAQLDQMEYKDRLGQLVLSELRARRVPKDLKVMLDLWDLQDHLDLMVNQGQLGLKAKLVSLEFREGQDQQGLQVHWVPEDHLDQRGFQVLLELQVFPEFLDRLDRKE